MRWPDSAAMRDSQGLFMAASVDREARRDFPQKRRSDHNLPQP